eukprot:61355-Amphidinium_carterae.1
MLNCRACGSLRALTPKIVHLLIQAWTSTNDRAMKEVCVCVCFSSSLRTSPSSPEALRFPTMGLAELWNAQVYINHHQHQVMFSTP